MEQTRLGSLIETIINTLVGFIFSFIAWPLAALMFDIQYNGSQHFGVVLFFTVISVVRGYIIRRWFNSKLKSASLKLARVINNV